MTIDELKAKIENLDATPAIEILDTYISEHPKSDEALTLRGMRYWSQGRRALAINDYLAALKINPHSRAGSALAAANNILSYYNKDLYNP